MSISFNLNYLLRPFLGAFTKLLRAIISFVMSFHLSVCTTVCPSVRLSAKKLGFHWMDFHKICYFRFFQKSVEKIQDSLKFDKNKGYFT